MLHAAGEAVDEGVAFVAEVGEFQHVVDDLGALRAVDVVGGGEEFEVFLHDHVFVSAEVVGDEADEGADGSGLIADDVIADARFAPGGLEERGEDFDGGGFAGAVGADETEAISLIDLEIEIGEGNEGSVSLGEVDGFYYSSHGVLFLSIYFPLGFVVGCEEIAERSIGSTN